MKDKRNFFVSAVYTSPPHTMGGNTNIMLQFINQNIDEYNFIVFTSEPTTFEKYVTQSTRIKVINVQFPYKKMSIKDHYQQVEYISNWYETYFANQPLQEKDFFYSCSDFAPDVIPIAKLKKLYKFRWIASVYLFIPSPYENLIKSYGFPFFKYVIYFLYQRILFYTQIIPYADFCFITNDLDRRFFHREWSRRVYAIYGGANLEDIEKVKYIESIKYDAVFCGRIHPQKGLKSLIKIWKGVTKKYPLAQLAIIGNSDDDYVSQISALIEKNKLTRNITMLGYVNGAEKFKIYKQSKMLLHTSVYDNNGMVIAEALCTGIPVIMYDHKYLRTVYNKGCHRATNTNKYIEIVCRVYKDYEDERMKIMQSLQEIREKWDWKNRFLHVTFHV